MFLDRNFSNDIINISRDHSTEHNLVCLSEECAEVIQACTKLLRKRVETPENNMNERIDNLIEEIADILINIDIIMWDFEINNFDVEKIIQQKIERYKERKKVGDNY